MPCMLCRQDDEEKLFDSPPPAGSHYAPLEVRRCRNCGLVHTHPELPWEERRAGLVPLRDTGPPTPLKPWLHAFQTAYCRIQYWRLSEPNPALRMLAIAMVAPFWFFPFLQSLVPYREAPGRLLDLGSGHRRQRRRANERQGWEVTGLYRDPDGDSSTPGGAVRLGAGTRKLSAFPLRHFDSAVLAGELERSATPRALLIELLTLVKDTGFLIVEVPNRSFLSTWMWGRHWSGYELPLNLHHFDWETVSRLLAECGWTPVRLIHHIEPDLWVDSLKARLSATDRLSWLWDSLDSHPGIWRLLFGPLALIERFLLQSGRMTLYCRKSAVMHPAVLPDAGLAPARGATG